MLDFFKGAAQIVSKVTILRDSAIFIIIIMRKSLHKGFCCETVNP